MASFLDKDKILRSLDLGFNSLKENWVLFFEAWWNLAVAYRFWDWKGACSLPSAASPSGHSLQAPQQPVWEWNWARMILGWVAYCSYVRLIRSRSGKWRSSGEKVDIMTRLVVGWDVTNTGVYEYTHYQTLKLIRLGLALSVSLCEESVLLIFVFNY